MPPSAEVTVNVPDDGTEIKGTNMTASQLQEEIQKVGNKITGKSKYVKGITGAGGDGNYLVLEFPQAKDAENIVVCSYDGGQETKLDTNDYQYLIKLNEKKPITVKVTGKEESNVTLDISEIVCNPDISG